MIFKRIHKSAMAITVLVGLAAFVCTGFHSSARAQDATDQPATGTGLSDARRAQLENELAQIEKDIADQQVILTSTQRQSVSLERDITILNTKIKAAQLQIKARSLNIQRLSQDITGKEHVIGVLSDKLGREKDSLAELLRKTDEIDSYSLAEIILANDNFSDFYQDIDTFNSIEQSLKGSFTQITDTKTQTEQQQNILEEKQNEEQDMRKLQELEAQRVAQNKNEKATILTTTKGQESVYKKVIASKQKDAAAIRAALFSLQGSAAIPFGKAYDLALVVQKQTGIRPAFLLGIVAEESNLGENVGKGNWKVDMHPTRDQPIFAQITAALGLNPDNMPVSKKAWYGYGGAMGPAQFIPSTWVLYQDKVSALTGHTPANPWEPQDAFMASGLLLKDNGGVGDKAAERRAAVCYLAGCKNASKASYAFYGNDVMALAEKWQAQIDILQGN